MYSEEGERLEEEADLEVELRNVHFSYPSRKRVQVCPTAFSAVPLVPRVNLCFNPLFPWLCFRCCVGCR